MNRYTLYCTEEQTKKALELGAPIEMSPYFPQVKYEVFKAFVLGENMYHYPTAEQMRGWLMEKLGATTFANKYYSCCKNEGYGFLIIGRECVLEVDASEHGKYLFNSDKEATLAAIDAALEYLTNNKK